jgi:DNA-binding transcriptional LysR family regulator
MLADVDAGIAEARMVAAGSKGVVRIGYSPTSIVAGLADVVTQFADRNPLVELTLREASSASLYEQYSRGELDLIISRNDGSAQPATSVKLIDDRIMAVLPEDHPAAGDSRLSLTQLNQDRFLFTRRSAAPEYVDRIMNAAYIGGLRPVRVLEVDSWSTSLALVRSGFGVTLATTFHRSEAAGTRFCDIEETLPDVSFQLVFDPDRQSPASAQFVTLLRTFFGPG